MPIYTPPVRDTRFILQHVVGLEQYLALPRYSHVDAELIDLILDGAGKVAADVLFPLNMIGDQEGCKRREDGSVETPTGFKAAYNDYVGGGWGSLEAPVEYGGEGLPGIFATAITEYMQSANLGFEMYVGLASAAVSAILVSGSDQQKTMYIPNMVAGKWAGTMNLTEPESGSDLKHIKTRAVATADGSHKITGTKMFISGGEQDLTENIIHLVLAKTPDVSGISLFIVPKFLVNMDGSLGERNALSCGSIEHKMGVRGSATCVMNYDGATGWLVGEEGRGLNAMFVMMNSARLGVGLQGVALAEVAYQNALAYAKDRRQGRALDGPKDPANKADLLIVHPDVRRMLMEAKALTEGMRAMCLWGSSLVDLSHHAESDKERETSNDFISLLTPVIKAFCTDRALDVTISSQQIWGGHGYICENGMEQFVRDIRIASIYEGANGLQAMDLVGRKLPMKGGAVIQAFFDLVDAEILTAKAVSGLGYIAAELESAVGELKLATTSISDNGKKDPNVLGAAGTAYLHMMGIVIVGLMWLRMAKVAAELLAKGEGEKTYLEAKLSTATFYSERFIPEAFALRRRVESGADTIMTMPLDSF